MNKLLSSLLLSIAFTGLILSGTATAADKPAAASDCSAKAVGSNGKPLSGAAKNSFMKKCEADTKASAPAASKDCEAKAVSKAGKPLSGAAKTSSIKKCEADSKK